MKASNTGRNVKELLTNPKGEKKAKEEEKLTFLLLMGITTSMTLMVVTMFFSADLISDFTWVEADILDMDGGYRDKRRKTSGDCTILCRELNGGGEGLRDFASSG